MFLWKVAGIQVSLQACHGLLQEMGRYVIPRYSPGNVHDYYRNKSMQQIYGYNIFPEVQDQIRYDGKTNPHQCWEYGSQGFNFGVIVLVFASDICCR